MVAPGIGEGLAPKVHPEVSGTLPTPVIFLVAR